MNGGRMGMVATLLVLVRLAAGPAAEPPVKERGERPVPALRAALGSFTADVEVNLGGRVRHGRVLVEVGGGIHLEHLDGEAARCCREHLQALESASGKGWDTRGHCRLSPATRHSWTQVGTQQLIAEVYWTVGTVPHRLCFTRHQTWEGRP